MDDHTQGRQNSKNENAPAAKTAFKKRKKITLSYLTNAGLYYLQRFPASKAQFRKVMMRKIDRSCKDHPDQDKDTLIPLLDEQVIPKFIDLGLINDALYSKGLASSLRRRGASTNGIVQKLRHKGLEPDDIHIALSDIDERIEESGQHADIDLDSLGGANFVAALTLARKKRIGPFSKTPPPDDQAEAAHHRDKQMAKLARQGFSYDIVQRVITMNQDDAETLLAQLIL